MLFSEPKIPQSAIKPSATIINVGFQCSSASRKFLNLDRASRTDHLYQFQCSSASRKFLNLKCCNSKKLRWVVFQCSSASRKFLNRNVALIRLMRRIVSVLFSEPKIPQLMWNTAHPAGWLSFSALQRAENSSIRDKMQSHNYLVSFSALQRAENSSIHLILV